jgi:hypothetical protein
MTLKIWDMNMEAKPVKTIKLHEQLRSRLCDLYENDFIFDKFECDLSHGRFDSTSISISIIQFNSILISIIRLLNNTGGTI